MKNKFLRNILIIVAIIFLFACINATNNSRKNVTIIEKFISSTFNFPQNAYRYFRNWITGNEAFFSDIDRLKKENEELKKKNEELENKMMDYEVVYSENKVLKEHSGIVDTYPEYKVVAADVISDSISNWQDIYTINKGSKDNVNANMAVITKEGLVGYISSVTENTAKVVSVLDAGNSVSARITRSRDAVLCKGSIALKEKNQLKLTYIPIGAEILVGDKIETSGMGSVYPKGIAVGTVKEVVIKKNPIENEAVIEPAVDFNRLETVAVIIGEKL
jgi:rod shape-determining protein MreC